MMTIYFFIEDKNRYEITRFLNISTKSFFSRIEVSY